MHYIFFKYIFWPPVTPSDGRNTWGRTAVCKKEDLAGTKKKGRTWGPSSTHQRERVGGEERYTTSLICHVLNYTLISAIYMNEINAWQE